MMTAESMLSKRPVLRFIVASSWLLKFNLVVLVYAQNTSLFRDYKAKPLLSSLR